ncbi:SDR family NAD(P)-dependent oxidoreductase [Caenibius sp. WL]|uniref:SDR family NAD(P)-dependent oxidoreductase n=1 Tax=Caenibius sp. WL TaxID=2872646 RepID=UPI001C99BC7B|nr:SDR family NAD(P)-dependent oxidoreductase [Caenibius sp. WL]QZP08472.1 SDR family oxidoreductase [Caenibius sp. WL]
MDFTGKAVLITGGASGIGYATAELFSRSGADIVIADLNEQGLNAAAQKLAGGAKGKVVPVACDTSDPDSCTRLIDESVKALGKLDVVCNIAGVLGNGPTEQFPDELWLKVLSVNLNGPFFISKRAIPHLLETGGCIVNVASTAGLVGIPYGAAYSASKSGVVGLTKSMAAEYSRRGVRVNAICPGHVLTPMTKDGGNFGPDVDLELMSRLSPLTQKGSDPSEMAAAIAFLASDAAVNATGTILTIDGGQTAI